MVGYSTRGHPSSPWIPRAVAKPCNEGMIRSQTQHQSKSSPASYESSPVGVSRRMGGAQLNSLFTPPKTKRQFGPRAISFGLVLAILIMGSPAWGQFTLGLTQAPGGVPINGTGPYTSGFGNVDGLGVGTPGAGLTVLTTGVAGGVLYTTPYNLVISGLAAGRTATVDAYVSANFVHPLILILRSCAYGASCGSAASYTTISLVAGSPTPIISTGVGNGTYTAYLGLFVSATNGASAFTGADSASVVFTATRSNGGTRTATLNLTNPIQNVQTAVQLLLATAPGGLTVSPGSDYAMNFGNVNGLGLGTPSAGLTVGSATGGVIYSTPYLIQPSFSSFLSTTASVKVHVSTDFLHPSALELRDAAASGGPYTAISKLSGSPTLITSSASSGSTLTRYLGLFVSASSGPGAFPGTAGGSAPDSATLTYTLIVP
jgi:hypothetical protein